MQTSRKTSTLRPSKVAHHFNKYTKKVERHCSCCKQPNHTINDCDDPRIYDLQLECEHKILTNKSEISYRYWLTHYTSIANITPMRYYDWVLTTPTMLINLICYLKFLQNTEKDFFGIMHDEFYTILIVLILNWLMLLFGYLGERFILPISASVLLGFIPFLLYYYIIYSNYVTEIGLPIFIYFFVFWSLYGVAASLPYNAKNTCYNMLDLVAKNFFGIFLFYMIIMNKS